jgi:hypothetical protein
VLGLITDFFRVAWGLFFWNARKTIFRVQKNKGICPCQTLSDSGLAGDTGCEPAHLFEKPIRFRHVCPLLKPNGKGELKCSVNTSEVRPFWRRFYAYYGVAVLGIYLLAVGTIFGAMRNIGYPISFVTLAWPLAWKNIDQVRSAYFLSNAEKAYATGDGSAALMSLSLAYEYDPTNYETGRRLAHLWSAGRPERANQIYEKLLSDHPENRVATAQAWLKGLLSRGDYARLESLAADAIIFDAESTPAWVHVFLFANRRTKDFELLERLLDERSKLPPGVENILAMDRSVRSASSTDAKQLLTEIKDPAEPLFVLHYRVRKLIQIGETTRALQLLNEWTNRVQDRDRIRLQLSAFANGGFREPYVDLIRQLIKLPPSLPLIELLSAHLIVYPNQALYKLIKQSVAPADIADANERLQSVLALYFMSLANGDMAGGQNIATFLRETTGSRFASLDAAALVIADSDRYRIENVLPALQPMSMDLIYALLERYETKPK